MKLAEWVNPSWALSSVWTAIGVDENSSLVDKMIRSRVSYNAYVERSVDDAHGILL